MQEMLEGVMSDHVCVLRRKDIEGRHDWVCKEACGKHYVQVSAGAWKLITEVDGLCNFCAHVEDAHEGGPCTFGMRPEPDAVWCKCVRYQDESDSLGRVHT